MGTKTFHESHHRRGISALGAAALGVIFSGCGLFPQEVTVNGTVFLEGVPVADARLRAIEYFNEGGENTWRILATP